MAFEKQYYINISNMKVVQIWDSFSSIISTTIGDRNKTLNNKSVNLKALTWKSYYNYSFLCDFIFHIFDCINELVIKLKPFVDR